MAKLGTHKRPIIARVQTMERAEEIAYLANKILMKADLNRLSRCDSFRRFEEKLTSESMQLAFSLLQDLAEEEGIDLDAVVGEPEADEPRVVHLLPSMAQRYALLVDEWVKNNNDWLESETRQSPNHLHLIKETPLPREDPISRKEALEVILWYQVFLPPKLYRALLSKTEEMELEEDDLPKDSEGSAKIALIGIDRSLSAWGELAAQWEGPGAELGKIVNHLTRLREIVEKEFPQARAFIRPGFDTSERSGFND
jgi:hypothetical protein